MGLGLKALALGWGVGGRSPVRLRCLDGAEAVSPTVLTGKREASPAGHHKVSESGCRRPCAANATEK